MSDTTRRGGAAGEEEMRFGFGANWADYIDSNFSDERVEISRKHLTGFLKLDSFEGKTFLDIGCGSGLHSLAAWRSGAKHVFSFDYDPNSVATTKKLHELSGSPSNWVVLQGSVLDQAFMNDVPTADIVYSWGVLHHTGEMWKAVENAGRRVDPNGVFYIALYSSDVYIDPPASYWLKIKKQYNNATFLGKKWMEWRYAARDLAAQVVHGHNPITHIREYKKSRGMSYWHDIRDWLGGWPMEFAGNKETELFARDTLGMDLIHIRAGEGNTEFLFRPAGATNYWDDVADASPLVPLTGPFAHHAGFAWTADLSGSGGQGPGDPAKFMLYENGSPVGWPNVPLSSITGWGGGRYRVDGSVLTFSACDNTDPNTSGRQYSFRSDFF